MIKAYSKKLLHTFEGNYWVQIASFIAVLFAAYQLYIGAFGVLPPHLLRATHLGFVLVLAYLIPKGFQKDTSYRVKPWDLFFALLSAASVIFLWYEYDYLCTRLEWVTPLRTSEKIFGTATVLLVIEGTRRTLGKTLAILAIVFILYALFGQYLPSVFRHSGVKLFVLLDQFYLGTEGLLGIPIGVSATYLVLFIIFGAFLRKAGAADWFIGLASTATARARSGPAQLAVFSSALFGTISGVAVGNVVTTGQMTIPLMKKAGYKPAFAGAVEAVASTGGQIMPPVMASVAFLMAELTGVPYVRILRHAILPAICYFLGVSVMVHLRSVKVGIQKQKFDFSEKDTALETLKKSYYIVPLLVLVGMLVFGFSPTYAAVCSIISTVVVSWFNPKYRMGPIRILQALSEGARAAIPVAMACAAAGIIIGVATITGLGLKVSSLVISVAGTSQLVALIITAIATLIFGMGLPTPAAYLITVSLIVPALIKLGVTTVAAHMFAIYFAVISTITPPVAVSAYAAAGLAEADFWKTAGQAITLGMAAYIVPFMFVYSPVLLLARGTALDYISVVITAPIGIFCLSVALQGWLFKKVNIIERVLFFGASLVLIRPGILTDVIGLAVGGVLLVKNWLIARRDKMSAQA